MLLASGQARTLPPSPGLRPSKCLGTKSDAIETAPAQFTHKMPLLPQPNCQRTPRTASNQSKQFSLSVRQGTNSPAKKGPGERVPYQTIPRQLPPAHRRTCEYTDASVCCQRANAGIFTTLFSAGIHSLQGKGFISHASQLYRTSGRRQGSPKRAATCEP